MPVFRQDRFPERFMHVKADQLGTDQIRLFYDRKRNEA
jgi:hypothetical protein